MDRDILIQVYFQLGLQYKEILSSLAANHRIVISMRTLKRILSNYRLFRRKNKSDVLDVALFIVDNLDKHGSHHGYRWVHLKCTHAGLLVDRETVRLLLQILDPVGVEYRRRRRLKRRAYFARGPNFLWHLDSYDKLKPYGFCINGCIDGFSRFMIWLKVNTTSSNPRVIAGYYMEAVSSRMGCPTLVRGDHGTENGTVSDMQNFLNDQGDRNTFLYGSSQHNQRIERWWGILRREFSQYWMDFFGTLKDEGYFTGDFIDKNVLQFCFMKLIQNQLDEVVRLWNTHRIGVSRNANVPSGRPLVMYTIPELYERTDHLMHVDQGQIDACMPQCIFRQYSCDEDVFQFCLEHMAENGIMQPDTPDSALDLYLLLREDIHRELNN